MPFKRISFGPVSQSLDIVKVFKTADSIKTFGSGGSKKKSQIPREYLGSLNQLVRLLEQVRDDGPGAYIDEIDGKQKPKLAYADDLWPIISICVKKSIEIPKPKIKINLNLIFEPIF